MHGACITCTAMHATVRVRKFVVNKISNGPGDDFLRAPIQIMTPSNRSHPTPTPRRQGSMLPGSQARRASARAVEFRTDRFDRTDYMRLQSAARARSVDGTVARGKMADPKKIVRFRKVSGRRPAPVTGWPGGSPAVHSLNEIVKAARRGEALPGGCRNSKKTPLQATSPPPKGTMSGDKGVEDGV